MNLVLFGPPGAGKGTQSALLVERLGMVQISSGDLFRQNMRDKTPLGLKAQSYIDKGELVPDGITIDMVADALGKAGGKSFILDGFPRTVAQAEALDQMLKTRNLTIGKAIFLEVPEMELVARLSGRRVCRKCGAVYHVASKPPKKSGVCDVCGGEIYQRDDDKEDVIANRLKVYAKNTLPLKGYYQDVRKFVELNGSGSTEEVFKAVRSELGQ